MTVCTKCGLSEPDVVFKRLKFRDRRCDNCFKAYDHQYYESIKLPKRRKSPEASRAAANKYSLNHKDRRHERWIKTKNTNRTREVQRRSHLKQKSERINLIRKLKSVPCVDCGKIFPVCAIDFHHRGHKIKTCDIHRMVYHSSLLKLLNEIQKCDVICANCHRLRTNKPSKNNNETKIRNRLFLDKLKRSNPCIDCLEFFEPCQMDFDHVMVPKVRSVGSMVHQSREKLMAEIAKCELVCANCHRIRTTCRAKSIQDNKSILKYE